MNKQILSVMIAAGIAFSAGMAHAAGTAFTGNSDVTGGTSGQCTLLSEDVTLGASKNVHGAWSCDETLNKVVVAACHEGGSRAQGPACVDTDPLTTGDQLPAGCAAAEGFSTIPDYKSFSNSSDGGVTTEWALGARCDNTTVAKIKAFP